MRSNAVGGRLLNSSLAWDGAIMMPLQVLVRISHPDTHGSAMFGKLDADTHWSEKLDSDPR